MAINTINNIVGNNLSIGQVLLIPNRDVDNDNSNSNNDTDSNNSYVVVSGDNLYNIALKEAVSTIEEVTKMLDNKNSDLPTILDKIGDATDGDTSNVFDSLKDLVAGDDDLDIGDIITFSSRDQSYLGLTVTHRIVGKQLLSNGEFVFRTKGDNNVFEDMNRMFKKMGI